MSDDNDTPEQGNSMDISIFLFKFFFKLCNFYLIFHSLRFYSFAFHFCYYMPVVLLLKYLNLKISLFSFCIYCFLKRNIHGGLAIKSSVALFTEILCYSLRTDCCHLQLHYTYLCCFFHIGCSHMQWKTTLSGWQMRLNSFSIGWEQMMF